MLAAVDLALEQSGAELSLIWHSWIDPTLTNGDTLAGMLDVNNTVRMSVYVFAFVCIYS